MKLKVALLFVLIAVGLHSYLSLHYYDLNFNPVSTDSVCNIGDKFSCDSVAVSQFSNIAGIPIALFGAVTNAVFAILLSLLLLGWVQNEKIHNKVVLWFSAIILAASVVMAFISFSMTTYCLFCILAYLLSAGAFIFVCLGLPPGQLSHTEALKALFTKQNLTFFSYFLAIPLITAFIHFSYLKSRNLFEVGARIQNTIDIWKTSPDVDFSSAQPSFTKGPDSAKLEIREFADFRCGHCKNASSKIKAFLGTRPDVKLYFYAFPLDGTCNEALGSGGDGISCFLAKTVYCSEKMSLKGLVVHDYFFTNQDQLNRQGTIDGLKELISKPLTEILGSLDSVYSCAADAETDLAIRKQAQLGQAAGVKGTPALFLNNKKISLGSSIVPVLEAAYQSLK